MPRDPDINYSVGGSMAEQLPPFQNFVNRLGNSVDALRDLTDRLSDANNRLQGERPSPGETPDSNAKSIQAVPNGEFDRAQDRLESLLRQIGKLEIEIIRLTGLV